MQLSFKPFCFSFFFFAHFIFPHGFADHTLICNTKNSWWTLDQVAILHEKKRNPIVLSYNRNRHSWHTNNITGVARAISNCYIRISFDTHACNDILCTPTQKFYLAKNKTWVSAYALKSHDKLLGKSHTIIAIKQIQFIQKSLPVISIEVEKTHTFYVGSYCVLTHNMFVPDIAISTVPIFSAAGLGASIGLLANPIVATITGGVLACGVIGYIAQSYFKKKNIHYKLEYDTNKIKIYFNANNSKTRNHNQNINTSTLAGGMPGPEDPKKTNNKKKKNSNKNLKNNSTNELYKAIKSHKKTIKEHEIKLDNYLKNPDKYDSRGLLANAQTQQQRNSIISSYSNHLKTEIRTFKNNILDILQELRLRGK